MPEEEAPISRENLMMDQYANLLAQAQHKIIELTADNQMLASALQAARGTIK